MKTWRQETRLGVEMGMAGSPGWATRTGESRGRCGLSGGRASPDREEKWGLGHTRVGGWGRRCRSGTFLG